MSPFRYAVSVDGIERNGDSLEKFDVFVFVNDSGARTAFCQPGAYIGLYLVRWPTLVSDEFRNVAMLSYSAEMPHGVHLILHQCNQRDIMIGRSFAHHQRRQLVAYAFPPPVGMITKVDAADSSLLIMPLGCL